MKTQQKTSEQDKGARKYPGVAIDISDDEKVSAKAVKDRTCTLNNNPRNND